MFNASQLVNTGVRTASNNAPTILTAFAAVGTIGTAVLTAKASFQASDQLRQAKLDKADALAAKGEPVSQSDYESLSLDALEAVKVVWPLYVPAATVGVSTVAAILLAHRISSKRAAALAAAYVLSEGRVDEYKEKVQEKFGLKKATEVEEEIGQDRVEETWDPDFMHHGIEGKVAIMDTYTGRYLWSTVETVNGAVNAVNKEILANGSASLQDFYDHIGLPPVATSDVFGWNSDDLLSVTWTTAAAPNDGPAVHVFDFTPWPILRPWDAASFR